MEKLKAILAEWRETPAIPVALSSLKADEAYQPRAEACVSPSQQKAEAQRSDDHVAVMAARLRRNKSTETEAILAADTPRGLFVVDGHHRLAAYKKAGRQTIPARIMGASPAKAIAVSKLVNFGGEKMGLHKDQRADAAWQTATQLTDRGRKQQLPEGITQEGLAVQFGIAAGTVNSMMKRLRSRSIRPEDYKAHHVDPGTGWPRWRFARNPHYGKDAIAPDPDERLRKAAHKLIRTFAEAMDRYGPAVIDEARQQARDSGMELAALDEWDAFIAEVSPEETEDY